MTIKERVFVIVGFCMLVVGCILAVRPSSSNVEKGFGIVLGVLGFYFLHAKGVGKAEIRDMLVLERR